MQAGGRRFESDRLQGMAGVAAGWVSRRGEVWARGCVRFARIGCGGALGRLLWGMPEMGLCQGESGSGASLDVARLRCLTGRLSLRGGGFASNRARAFRDVGIVAAGAVRGVMSVC